MNLSLHFLVILLVFYSNTIKAQDSEELEEVFNAVFSPRTVTDLEIIYGPHGVPIDYNYNETIPSNKVTFYSSPGCPQSIDGHPWVWHKGPTGNLRCFLAGHSGPCPFGQKLLGDYSSYIGQCVCECVTDNKNGYLEVVLPNTPERFLVCKNPNSETAYEGQVYDTKDKKCHLVFEQGPCEKGKVIAGWSETEIRCLKPCDRSESDWEKKSKNKKCAKGYVSSEIPNLIHYAEEPSDCPDWKVYSNILRKCIKKHKPAEKATDNVKVILKKK